MTGLVVLPSFISPERQRELVQWSLCQQARSPNETNLDTHYCLPPEGIWEQWLQARKNPENDHLVETKLSSGSPTFQENQGPRQRVDNMPASPANFATISASPKYPPTPSQTAIPIRYSALLYKLRWANIGWSYHWGTKQYDFAKGRALIDRKLRELCKSAVAAVDWAQVYADDKADWGADDPFWTSWEETYEPDAGIVNFYQTKDTLMAHVDKSELCATSPLVSISLGNAAVFLIGGRTRDIEPVPILLRSGDVIIMSGPECRRAYHGVPRILEDTLPSHFLAVDEAWEPYEHYLRTARININVRQVFPKGFEPRLPEQ